LFLANTNVGNAVDIGVVGTYNDGTLQRYEGLYRAASDGRFRLFTNLATPPGTLVTTNDGSYRYGDLWLGNANVTATTASTSSLTGALLVSGGVGISGATYLNGQNNSIAIGNGGSSGTGDFGASGATFGQYWGTNGQFSGYVNATGNILAATATLNNITVNGSVNSSLIPGGTSNSYTLGSTTQWWNKTWSQTVNALYADLAEKYQADAAYEPGTVVMFGGTEEVTLADVDTPRVAGVVSTQPGYLLNGGLNTENSIELALTGRVPCKVTGTIRKGDMLTSAGNGYAHANHNPAMGTVIGKALEDHDDLEGIIEVVVGRY